MQAKMNFTRENPNSFQTDLLNIIWNNERTSMAHNLLVLLTVPLIMTAVIMILIEIKVSPSTVTFQGTS